MSELLALGASHKTAPLAVRERLALLDGQVEPFLQELTAHPGVTEAVAVSTCNRTELYVVAETPEAARAALETRAGADVPLYVERNCDAARHLHRVVRIERHEFGDICRIESGHKVVAHLFDRRNVCAVSRRLFGILRFSLLGRWCAACQGSHQ